jgi:membrane-associated phospholipid phosphatase
MNSEILINLIIIIVLAIYFKGYFQLRYFTLIPTIELYPNNDIEVLEVNNFVKQNNRYYLDLFKKTDETVVNAFIETVDMDREELNKMALSLHLILVTLLLKTFFNRARPKQVDTTLNIQTSTTANTPAYPSGHCIQAYYLAKKLSIYYPNKRDKLFKLAEDCAMARVYAGLHYPSDNEFGKYISLNIL